MSQSKDKESMYAYRLYLMMQGIIGLLFAMIFTVELCRTKYDHFTMIGENTSCLKNII